MSKLNILQLEEALARAAYGESVRSIAVGMGVTEGALRHHFRKGIHPKELRRLAFELIHAEQILAKFNDKEKRLYESELGKLRNK
jgi:predicted transcriptional regulator